MCQNHYGTYIGYGSVLGGERRGSLRRLWGEIQGWVLSCPRWRGAVAGRVEPVRRGQPGQLERGVAGPPAALEAAVVTVGGDQGHSRAWQAAACARRATALSTPWTQPTLRSAPNCAPWQVLIPRTEACATWWGSSTARSATRRSTPSPAAPARRPGRRGAGSRSSAARARARTRSTSCELPRDPVLPRQVADQPVLPGQQHVGAAQRHPLRRREMLHSVGHGDPRPLGLANPSVRSGALPCPVAVSPHSKLSPHC